MFTAEWLTIIFIFQRTETNQLMLILCCIESWIFNTCPNTEYCTRYPTNRISGKRIYSIHGNQEDIGLVRIPSILANVWYANAYIYILANIRLTHHSFKLTFVFNITKIFYYSVYIGWIVYRYWEHYCGWKCSKR